MSQSRFFQLMVLAIGVWLGGSWEVRGQMVPPPAGAPSSASSMMTNPYMNPYLNPYLNPATAGLNPYANSGNQRSLLGPGSAGLFLYQANIANGGIGSGRISGTRPLATPRKKPAIMPDSSAVPGSGAARYFNPGPVNVNGAGRYFNRGNTYFMNNRR